MENFMERTTKKTITGIMVISVGFACLLMYVLFSHQKQMTFELSSILIYRLKKELF